MFNARTWHRLCISAYLAFPAIIIGWLLPRDSPLMWLVVVAVGWGFFIAALGAVQGILFAFGRLRMGCPECNAKCDVTGGNRFGMWLDCPKCGEMLLRLGRLGKLVAEDTEELAGNHEDTESPLLVPKRHPVAFALMIAPVAISIVAASVIHEFSFFYLIIPGFWCYGVSCFILGAIFSGKYGRYSRSREPIRFWGNIAIWSMFYVFAAYFPIGFAKQESAKEAGKEPAGMAR